ncbi:DinB family protein [soil metagenome]
MGDDPLRNHLVRLLQWEDAHITFEAAVAGLGPEFRTARPDGVPYSAWQLVEHMRIAQRDIIEFCRDPACEELEWPNDYWPDSHEPPSDDGWRQSIDAFLEDRAEMVRIAMDPTLDLFAEIPHGTGQTYLREILLVADHNAYHLGELVLLRRGLGAWPPR